MEGCVANVTQESNGSSSSSSNCRSITPKSILRRDRTPSSAEGAEPKRVSFNVSRSVDM